MMQVKIKEFKVEMEVKSGGIGFEVRDTKGKFLGDCYVTMTGIEWCKGKIPQGNGRKTKWEDFISAQESEKK
jgi:hypothetical protein